MKCLLPYSKYDGLNIFILLLCLQLSVKCVVSKQPNIIFIIADDLGWNDVGFHGGNDIPTPNIDALAYNGIVLNRHYSQPTCSPSRAAFLTGKYPIRLGIESPIGAGSPRAVPLKEKLLPQYLKDLGYSTHLIGKWHIGCYREDFLPLNRGYDHHTGYWNGFLTYNDSTHYARKAYGYDARRDDKPYASQMSSKYLTEYLTDEAIGVIQSHNQSTPLFLQISHAAVHTALAAKGQKAGILQVPNVEENDQMFSYIEDKDRRLFAGMLKSLDDSMGRVIQSLKDEGMLENSVLIFIADNGGVPVDDLHSHANAGSNWPLRGEKYSVYDGGVRTVATIWSPLLKKSQVMNNLMHITDWLPTLYFIAGGDMEKLSKELDGRNQWNTLETGANETRDSILVAILTEYSDEACIHGDWKLVKVNLSSLINFSHVHFNNTNSGKREYDPDTILISKTNEILSTYHENGGDQILTKELIQDLRKRSSVECGSRQANTENCTVEYCLYNIKQDPCEHENIAHENPDIVQQMKALLQSYKMEMENIPVQWSPYEEVSNPMYWGGYWCPWKEHTIKLYVNEAIVFLAGSLCLLIFLNYTVFKK